ncbi:UTRA domain-containing protein [Kribbella swartbergensis]
MHSIGVHITHVGEDVAGRAARRHEAETLTVRAGVPVLVIERTYYERDPPGRDSGHRGLV